LGTKRPLDQKRNLLRNRTRRDAITSQLANSLSRCILLFLFPTSGCKIGETMAVLSSSLVFFGISGEIFPVIDVGDSWIAAFRLPYPFAVSVGGVCPATGYGDKGS